MFIIVKLHYFGLLVFFFFDESEILWLSPNLIFQRYGVHPFKVKGINHGHYETYKHEDIMPMDDH